MCKGGQKVQISPGDIMFSMVTINNTVFYI